MFLLCELPLILGVGGKLKKRLEIFTRGPYISNLNEIGQLVQALRSATVTQTDTDTDTHTHTHTHTYTHTFLDSGSDVESKIIKKSKSNFLTIAILPSLLMSLESKNGTGVRSSIYLGPTGESCQTIWMGCIRNMTICLIALWDAI